MFGSFDDLGVRLKKAVRKRLSRYSGVYSNFLEAGVPAGVGYVSEDSVKDAARKVEKVKDAGPWRSTGNTLQPGDIAFLGLLSGQSGSVEVVDVGGGAGISFFQAYQHLFSTLQWIVVEQLELVEYGREHYASYHNLRFEESAPPRIKGVTRVVLLRSTLQYIPDPYETLELLAKEADYVVLVRLPADELTEFVTIENFQGEGSQHPMWIFDRQGMQEFMGDRGFELLFRFGDFEVIQMPGLPYNAPSAVTLGFKRSMKQ